MTGGTNYRWVTILVAAFFAGVVAAVAVPRFVEEEAVGWGIAVAVAVLTAVLVALATHERVDEGRHVRDDALPPE